MQLGAFLWLSLVGFGFVLAILRSAGGMRDPGAHTGSRTPS